MRTYAHDGLVFDVKDEGPEDGFPAVFLHGFPRTRLHGTASSNRCTNTATAPWRRTCGLLCGRPPVQREGIHLRQDGR